VTATIASNYRIKLAI